MNRVEPHVHEFRTEKEPIIADNPKFDRSLQFYFVVKVCDCGEKRIVKMVKEGGET